MRAWHTVVIFALLACISAPTAAAASRWPPGTPIRLQMAKAAGTPRRYEGTLVATGDTLLVSVPTADGGAFETLSVVVSDVKHAEVCIPEPARGVVAPIVGALLGGGLGLLGGGAYAISTIDSGAPYGMAVLVVSTLSGAALGTWIGARGASHPGPLTWYFVPPGWLRER